MARPTTGFPRLAALVIGLLCLLHVSSYASPPGEYTVKGAFLYNILKYVDRAERSDSSDTGPLVIAIAGEDPFGSELDEALVGRSIRGRAVHVIRFHPEDPFPHCHLLFTVTEDPLILDGLLRVAVAEHVLSVGESDAFLSLGGVMRLAVEGSRVRFDVNLSNAQRAGLFVSATLLKLARHVFERPEK